MFMTWVLVLSIFFQFLAAFLALRLIKVAEKSSAWVFISSALFLMGFRRLPVSRIITGDGASQPNLVVELVALITSVLLVIGIARITPLFRIFKPSDTTRHDSSLPSIITSMLILLGAMRWLDEIVDLPHHLLGAPRTPINWQESIFETILLALFGLFIVSKTNQYVRLRKQAEIINRELAKFPEENPNPVLRISRNGKVLYANQGSAELLQEWHCTVGQQLPERWRQVVLETLDGGLNREEEMICGTQVFALALTPIVDGGYVNIYGRNITDRKQAEQERTITIEFLRLINECQSTRTLIQSAVTFFQQQSGCQAVGIRLKDGDDYPYFEAHGFPPAFLRLENSLCARDLNGQLLRDDIGNPIIECMCGNVICGRFDPSKPFFTARGSFWSNNTTALLASTTEADRQARTRNRCNGEGYESVALLPLISGNDRLGLLQLNDRRTGVFSPDLIALWERLAGYLAVALAKSYAEEALRALSSRQEAILSAVPDIMMEVDDNKVYTWANQAGVEFFGPDVVGKEAAYYFEGDQETYHVVQPLFNGDENVIYVESWQRCQDGERRLLAWWCRVLKDAQGNVVGALSTARDITDLKHAEEELRRLNAELEQRVAQRTAELSDLYNNAPCGYHSLDGDGVFIHINDTELKWLGYTREEIIGKMKATDLLTPASVDTFHQNFPIFKACGWLENLELDMVRKDGSILSVLLNATVVADQSGHYLMSRSTIIDYTERRRAEVALSAAQARLQASNQELEAFAYSVSHDLRAPLRAINGFTQMILEDYGAQFDAEGQRLFNVVRTSAQKMDQLITDLLTLSRITRSEMRMEPLDMTVLVQTIYQDIAPPEIQPNVVFSVMPLPEAQGDATLIRQVWSNLLANAFKYTRPRTERHIQVGGYTERGMNVYYVQDNGVGFDPRYTHKLFGVFQRLHKANEFEGTGVGLSIVHRIVQRHGGKVWAEGVLNQGAIFYFALPTLNI